MLLLTRHHFWWSLFNFLVKIKKDHAFENCEYKYCHGFVLEYVSPVYYGEYFVCLYKLVLYVLIEFVGSVSFGNFLWGVVVPIVVWLENPCLCAWAREDSIILVK